MTKPRPKSTSHWNRLLSTQPQLNGPTIVLWDWLRTATLMTFGWRQCGPLQMATLAFASPNDVIVTD